MPACRATVCLTLLVCPLSVLATELPPGFAETDVLPANQVFGARSFDWSPDGVLWVAQVDGVQGSKIWAYRGAGRTLALDFGWFPDGDKGFQTVLVDHDYAQNNHVWVYYSVQDPAPGFNRLSRFTSVNDQLTDEVPIIDGPPIQSALHYGGCLGMTSDGHLLLAIGDDFQWSATAQDPFDIRGKVLKVHRDGTPSEDNPWYGTANGDERVWAWGLRSPFRCTVEPVTDALYWGDVGSYLYEEINLGAAGGDYGWADAEGPDPAGLPGRTYPAYSYPSRLPDGTGAAVIVGDFAEADDLGGAYTGELFWADRIRKEIYHSEIGAQGEVLSVDVFATIESAHLTDLAFGPDGALYYSSGGTIRNIRRIEWVGGANRQPHAVAAGTPDAGAAPLIVSFDGTASSDPDDDELTYSWDLGDSTGASGDTTVKSYPAGVYEARLTVNDGDLDDVSPPLRIVSGNTRPTATVTAPANGAFYNAGDTITLTGSVTDAEDAAIPCSQYSWQGIFHHNDHTHPFFGPVVGECGKTITLPVHGEDEVTQWYRFRLVVQDNGTPLGSVGALDGVHEVEIFPNVSQITLETAPHADFDVRLDTQTVTAPVTRDSVVGYERALGVVEDQQRDGRTWNWVSWSDGGDEEHDVSTPAQPTTYTATFGCNVPFEVQNLSLSANRHTDQVMLTWSPMTDMCLLPPGQDKQYQVHAASTARPAVAGGSFPDDPAFVVVGSTDATSFTYLPAPDDTFFLVTPVGTDLRHGAVGHYGE